MCAISGAFSMGGSVDNKIVKHVLEHASERGRDSFGVYTDGITKKTYKNEKLNIPSTVLVILANNRGEPTTEYVENKTEDDVQPYISGDTVLIHNGTIANDKELAKKYGFREFNIDTKLLAPLLEYKKWSGGLNNLYDVLKNDVVGSYALGIYHQGSEKLFLACNYKPIYYTIINKVVYFSSLDKYLPDYNNPYTVIHKVEPYSIMEFSKDGKIVTKTLRKKVNKKALVVCSGGLDSTVVATKLQKDGYDVTLLHIKYKARAEDNEVKAIRKIAKHLNVNLLEVETDIFKNVIKASRLTNTKDDLVTEREGEASAELAHEWVPARNLIMLSIATGISEARGIENIALGNNLEEAGAYADNEQEFINTFNKVIPNAINLDKFLQVIEPVGNLMKHEIVKLGLEINAPLHLTWSCYNSGKLHCGTCGPCYMRKKAFQMNNAKEVIKYLTNT